MSGPSSWWVAHLAGATPPSIESLPPHVQVLVVGAGMMGLSTAWALARKGLDVLVLDSRAPFAAASARNAGIMTTGMELGLTGLARFHDAHVAEDVYRRTRESEQRVVDVLAEHAPDGLVSSPGFIALWLSPKDQDAAIQDVEAYRRLGLQLELLERDAAADVLGTELDERVLGGSYTAFDQGIDPAIYALALAQRAVACGARLAYPVEARGIERAGDALRVATSRGELSAEHVVVATNNRTELLLPRARTFLSYHRDLVAVSRPRHGTLKTAFMTGPGIDYGQPLGRDRLVVGGFGTSQTVDAHSMEDVPSQTRVEASLDAFLERTFPSLRGAELEYFWSGVMAYSGDDLPVVGPWPDLPGVWLITGFGGDGLSFSQWCPRVLADAVASRSREPLPRYLAAERFLAG